MTKITIILLSSLFVLSCAGNSSPKEALMGTIADSLHIEKDLGPLLERHFEGTIPAADCPGIVMKLTLYNQEYCGDGVFTLSQTYLEAEDGKDMTFTSQGEWYTLRGDAVDPNATVYQLHPYGENQQPTNFLFQHDSVTMLMMDMRVPDSGLNYTLRKR